MSDMRLSCRDITNQDPELSRELLIIWGLVGSVTTRQTHIGHLSSFSLEHRFAFLKKRTDAFVLVFSREAQCEEINFASQSFIKI